jgi:acyl dehydratase
MSTAKNLTLRQVATGDVLPTLAYDVTATTVVLGAMASRDWRPMHHDYDFAVNRNGTKNIFLNTPNQAAWFERYLTDWTGPKGRLGRIQFRMKDSVYPNDTMVFAGRVAGKDEDAGWVDLEIELKVGDKVVTGCSARVALPKDESDNPWQRRGADWQP